VQYGTGNLLFDPLNLQVQNQLISLVQSLGNRSDVNAIELDDHFSILTEDQQDQNKFFRDELSKGVRFLNKQLKNNSLPEAELKKLQAYLDKLKFVKTPRELVLAKHPVPKGLSDDEHLKNELTKLLRKIKVAAKGKPIYISVNGSIAEANKSAQDVNLWVREKLVDKVNFQVYRKEQTSFVKTVQDAIEWTQGVGLKEISIGISTYAQGEYLSLQKLKKQAESLELITTKNLKVYGVGFDFFKFLTLCSENPIDPKTGQKSYKGNCFSPDA
jgi:uncharacterized lipoprotein YddW (UPF0748 family)